MSGNNKPSNKPKNKWGDPIYIKPGESWFNIMEEEERQAALRAEERRREEAAAAAAAAERLRQQREQSRIAQLRRNTQRAREELIRLDALAAAAPAEIADPKIGDFKKGANGQLYRWALLQAAGPGYRRQRAQWHKVSRETNYEPDLQVYLNRVRRLGTNYQSRRRNRRSARRTNTRKRS
jgi:hypothetical protein